MSFCMAAFTERRGTGWSGKLWVLMFLAVVSLCLPLYLMGTQPAGQAKNGVVDLADAGLEEGKRISLAGEWEFFSGRQIATELSRSATPDGLVTVPSYGGARQDGTGCGSYRLRLVNCPPEVQVMLSLRGMPAAYRIFVDGQPVERSGMVSQDSAASRVQPGFLTEREIVLRSSSCEIVVETGEGLLSGLSLAPVLVERETFLRQYDLYCALSLLLFGMGILIAGAYAMDLFLTPRSGYSPAMLLAMVLLLLKGLSVDGVCTPLLAYSMRAGYDWMVLLADGAEMGAWLLLLFMDYHHSCWKKNRLLWILLWCGVGGSFLLTVAGLNSGNTLWWVAAPVLLLPAGFWRLLLFLRAPEEESWILADGYILLWLGGLLCDLAFAGRIRPMWKLSFFVGMVAFALAVSVVDRRRMDGIQSEALRAAQMEAQLQRARTDIALHQIKPHFLHNALMSIKVLCRTRPKEAEQAIYDFTIFLRGNMKSLESPEPVPFREEVEAISCYLRIEQIRFRQRLRVVWDLEEDNFSVPPLTIQPLVENAVRHGVCQKPEGGTVTIASRRTEEAILVEITDDGVGFDVSAVEESGGIGIRNLRLRLREQLGAVLDIQSTPGKGTVQTVRIPLRRKEDEDHTGGR